MNMFVYLPIRQPREITLATSYNCCHVISMPENNIIRDITKTITNNNYIILPKCVAYIGNLDIFFYLAN